MKKAIGVLLFVFLGMSLLVFFGKLPGINKAFNQPGPILDHKAIIPASMGWSEPLPIPSQVFVGKEYQGIYRFKSNLESETSLVIVKIADSDFTFDDQCTGKTLLPQQSCEVKISLKPSYEETKTLQLEMHYAPNHVVPLPERHMTVRSGAHVVGHVMQPLPPNINPGQRYPVSFLYKNEGSASATSIQVQKDYPLLFTETANTCTGDLASEANCEIHGNLVASKKITPIKRVKTYTPGRERSRLENEIKLETRVGVALSTAESEEPVHLETTAVVSAVTIEGQLEQALPSRVSVGSAYLVRFSFHNFSSGTATDVLITPNYADGFLEEINTCSGSLAGGATCYIQGKFTPTSEGNHTVGVSLTYAQGQATQLTSSTSAVKIHLHGEVATPLPTNANLNTVYPVKFLFTNFSELPALGLTLTKDYPAEFTEKVVTCVGTLAAHAQCEITGEFRASSTAEPNKTIGLTLAYHGGDPILLNTRAFVSEVAITGSIDRALPLISPVGSSHALVFLFRNNSTRMATDVSLIRNYPPEFQEDFSTCQGSTLAAGATCQVFGTLRANQTISYEVGVNLVYAEGQAVPLITATLAARAAIRGRVNLELPPNISVGSKHPVRFLFTNASEVPATAIQLMKQYHADFHETKNTCGATLAAGASCELLGEFQPTQVGENQRIAVSLSYAEGETIPLATSAAVRETVIEGAIEKALPEVTAINTAYELIFKFHNADQVAASGITLSNHDPENFQIKTNTCTDTLAVGASCRVSGEFTPKQEVSHSVGITLAYHGGRDISLVSHTWVGKGCLIAVGEKGARKVSYDGKSWINNDTDSASHLNAVAWSGPLQRFVIVGNNDGGQGLARYSQEGLTWSGVTTTSTLPRSIVWSNELSQYLVVGNEGIIETSPDGINWTRQVSHTNSNLYSAVWNETLHEYAVVGANATILTSPDGVSWEEQQSGIAEIGLFGAAWSATRHQYVVGMNSSSSACLISPDGRQWTWQEADVFRAPIFELKRVDALDRYVAVGRSDLIATSDNGKAWVLRQLQVILQHSITDVIWHPSSPLGTGTFFASGSFGYVHKSPDGITWESQAVDGGIIGPQRQLRGVGEGIVLSTLNEKAFKFTCR